jgi:predicted HicB family RNase H-like nuclease
MATKKAADSNEAEQKFVLRLPKGFHTALRHVAIDRGLSLNALITQVLDEWWAKQPENRKYKA